MNRLLTVYHPDGPRPSLHEMIALEHSARLRQHSLGNSYHYWEARGDSEPPNKEYFCQYCAGYYGVPHDWEHKNKVVPDGTCSNMRWTPHCACIDCEVYRAWKNYDQELYQEVLDQSQADC